MRGRKQTGKRKRYYIICKFEYGRCRCLNSANHAWHQFSDTEATIWDNPPVYHVDQKKGEFIARVHAKTCPVDIDLTEMQPEAWFPKGKIRAKKAA